MYIVMIVDTQRKVVLHTRVCQTIAKKFDGHKNPSEDVAHKAIILVWVYGTIMFKLCSPCIEVHVAVLDRNRTLFCCIFRSHYRIRSAVTQYFRMGGAHTRWVNS